MELQQTLVTDIKSILQSARNKSYTAINFAMVEAYWQIGRRIVLEEQHGEQRAEYGAFIIKELSVQLTSELGKGFTIANLKNIRQFYLTFREISKSHAVRSRLQKSDNQGDMKSYAVRSQLAETDNPPIQKGQIVSALFEPVPPDLRKELTWTHYRLIMRLENPNAQLYYINEAADHNWSTRLLERNINTLYYERILSSKKTKANTQEIKQSDKQSPADFIKDPYIFEFLNIPELHNINELEVETALIENLQNFLLELGKGFSFVKRQFRINTETKHFYVDLVLYNYILKCFVLFDLKIGELSHQDIGQMDMYVRMFDDLQRSEGDNPTIGVILCTHRDETIVKYSTLNGNDQLFATKYRSYLPTEEELIAEIEREKLKIREKLFSQNN